MELWMQWDLWQAREGTKFLRGPDAPAAALTPKLAAELINPKEMEKREVET